MRVESTLQVRRAQWERIPDNANEICIKIDWSTGLCLTGGLVQAISVEF